MSINIKYFGSVAEATGKDQESMELPAPTTVHAINEALKAQYGNLGKLKYRIAVNQELVAEQHEVNNNDELALLPPFAGG